jgi:hypothetical protein
MSILNITTKTQLEFLADNLKYLTEEEKELIKKIEDRVYLLENEDRQKQYGINARKALAEYQRTGDYDAFCRNAQCDGFGVDDIPWLIDL